MTRVSFIPVKEGRGKLEVLFKAADKHFFQGTPFLFLVNDQKGLEFLDNFLWTFSSESFLPHPSPLLEISLEMRDPFFHVFNLRPLPLLELNGIKVIYEFDDHTSSERRLQSREKYDFYRQNRLIIDSA